MLPHVPPTQSPLLFEHEQVEKVIRAVLESYIGDVTNENVKTGGETANRSRTMCTTSDEDGQKMECTQHERFVAYDGRQSAQLCVIISDQIRNRVKQLSYERYKIVCLTQIFENKHQGISSVARLLCDTSRDRYAIVKKQWAPVNNSRAAAGAEGNNGNVATAFLVVTVFAIYHP